jgi:hypothetical protein
LGRAWVAGADEVPWPTHAQVQLDRLVVERQVGESGSLVAPWSIEGAGRLLSTTTTLMERPYPYDLLVELARGKVHQLRTQAAEWQDDSLLMTFPVTEQIGNASRAFYRAVSAASAEEAGRTAQLALSLSYAIAEQLVQDYTNQVLQLRRQYQPRANTALGCRLSAAPTEEGAGALTTTFDSIEIAFPWSTIEPDEGRYDWSQQDALLDWAVKQGLAVTGGPVVDFSATQLPDWLWLWERDLRSLDKFLSNYVAAALERYCGRVRHWHLISAGNSASVLSLSEHELLWLTIKAARLARQLDPDLDLIIGIAQPWSDYMAREDRVHSALLFAETLVRELKVAALDLEVVMGVTPRGSYCRDLLDTSRLLDSYADLGVPLQVTFGYPSASTVDPKADPELRVDAGHWHGGVLEATQAEWARSFVMLALSKPYVEAVHWVHPSDGERHQFPHCGVLNEAGKPKASFHALEQLRAAYLR